MTNRRNTAPLIYTGQGRYSHRVRPAQVPGLLALVIDLGLIVLQLIGLISLLHWFQISAGDAVLTLICIAAVAVVVRWFGD